MFGGAVDNPSFKGLVHNSSAVLGTFSPEGGGKETKMPETEEVVSPSEIMMKGLCHVEEMQTVMVLWKGPEGEINYMCSQGDALEYIGLLEMVKSEVISDIECSTEREENA